MEKKSGVSSSHAFKEQARRALISRLGQAMTVGNPVAAHRFEQHMAQIGADIDEHIPEDFFDDTNVEKQSKLIDMMCSYAHSTIIQPGTNVGILAAQAVGEKSTQMTLNSFHSAGLAMETVVSGVARCSELINVTSNPKGSSATLVVAAELCRARSSRPRNSATSLATA
jgi:hypothetical protein